jgi:hypothetical protein
VQRAVGKLNFHEKAPTLEYAPDLGSATTAVIGSDAMERFLVVTLPAASEFPLAPPRICLPAALAVLQAKVSLAVSDQTGAESGVRA